MQGILRCDGCGCDGCAQCGCAGDAKQVRKTLAWDIGEIYGHAEPTTLPAPTTSSLARTVVMWPGSGQFAQLDIRDAERAQGLSPGHTEIPNLPEGLKGLSAAGVLAQRFKCVGNALHGKVGT